MDGSVMPANPGVNPSLMITALAERAMSFWPEQGRSGSTSIAWFDLSSISGLIHAAQTHRRTLLPGALRLNARKEDIIPLYPD